MDTWITILPDTSITISNQQYSIRSKESLCFVDLSWKNKEVIWGFLLTNTNAE